MYKNIVIIAFEYVKYHILNCRERYEDLTDHCSYTHNLSSREIKACQKKIQAWMRIEPMTSAIPVQCCTNWSLWCIILKFANHKQSFGMEACTAAKLNSASKFLLKNTWFCGIRCEFKGTLYKPTTGNYRCHLDLG